MSQNAIIHLLNIGDEENKLEIYYHTDDKSNFVLKEKLINTPITRARYDDWEVTISVKKEQVESFLLDSIISFISGYPEEIKFILEDDDEYSNYRDIFHNHIYGHRDELQEQFFYCLSKMYENLLNRLGVPYQKEVKYLNHHTISQLDESGNIIE